MLVFGLSSARADDPPPADSVAAVRERTAQSFLLLSTIGDGLGLDPSRVEPPQGCRSFLAGGCKAPDAASCREALGEALVSLRAIRGRQRDALGRAVSERAASQLSGTLSLLAWLHEPRACTRLAPPGLVPASVRLGVDDRELLVQPLRPLRAGRGYALVFEGSAAAALAEIARRPPRRALERLLSERFTDAPGAPNPERVATFIETLADLAPPNGDLAPFAGLRLRVPEPLSAGDLASLRAFFVSVRKAPKQGVVARVRTLDARSEMLVARRSIREPNCPPIPLETTSTPELPVVLRGETPTLDLAAVEEGPRGGRTPTVRPPLSFLLSPPSTVGLDAETPLVIALDGHRGSARRMLGQHSTELAARGLATASVDLPGHGTRASEGDFVVAEDPLRLRRGIRQSAIDLIALVRAARRCGFLLPGGQIYQPRSVRFLGYSLGAMIGVLVRAVEPELGTTVLLAPGGDLHGWLMLRLGPALGARFVACFGGADHGQSCITDGECTPPGRCIVDPFFETLHDTLGQPYRQATAFADPLSFAAERTGPASGARILLITGGNDAALYPALASRLADAYGMHMVAPHRRRGPNALFEQWPQLGHDLHECAGVRRQAYDFLASDGRRLAPGSRDGTADAPPWYRVFGRSRP